MIQDDGGVKWTDTEECHMCTVKFCMHVEDDSLYQPVSPH